MSPRPAAFRFVLFALLLNFTLTACGSSQTPIQPRNPSGAKNIAPVISETGEFAPVQITTSSGAEVQARLWRTEMSLTQEAGEVGILFVSGNIWEPFVEPVDGIYDRLAVRFATRGVVSLFLNYRQAGDLETSLEDAMAGVTFLRNLGVKRIALVGWSFGGAVITNLAPLVPEVVTVLGISAQSKDTEAVSQFSHQSLLLLHSQEDDNVPFYAAGQIFDEAPATIHKELHAFETGNHYLTGMASQVDPIVSQWLENELHI